MPASAGRSNNPFRDLSRDINSSIPTPGDLAQRICSLETLYAFLPTYLQRIFSTTHSKQYAAVLKKRQGQKTAWLHGLRGVAAIIVVVYHYFIVQPHHPLRPYYLGPYDDVGGDEFAMEWTSPLSLPIIRLLHSGDLMVPIFFVISGFVLSFRQVRMINSNAKGDLLDILFSSVLRRGFRLFLPVAAIVAIVHMGTMLGLHAIYDIPPGILSPFKHFISQMWQIVTLSWEIDLFTDYYQQLWTIPAEFACSMVLFVFQVGVSGMRPLFRLISTATVMFVSLFSGHWGVALFFSGWLIAETEYMFETSGMDSKWHSPKYYAFWITMLITGMFLGSYPSMSIEQDMFLHILPTITPTGMLQEGYQETFHFWLAISATMMVWSLFRLRTLHRIFNTRLGLYLGDISYSVYLVHYQIVIIERDAVRLHADRFFGKQRLAQSTRIMAWTYEVAIILFFTTWQADLCWRYIDEPSVKIAKWVELRLRKPPARPAAEEIALLPTQAPATQTRRRATANGHASHGNSLLHQPQ